MAASFAELVAGLFPSVVPSPRREGGQVGDQTAFLFEVRSGRCGGQRAKSTC